MFFIVLEIVIAIVVLSGIGYYIFEIRPTAIVLLETDIDPLLAIRGKLIALDYKISRIPFSLLRNGKPEDIESDWSNNDIYVVLEKQGKYWNAVSAYRKIPRKKDIIFVWGKCNSKENDNFYVRYNIDSLLLNDETANLIKKQLENTQNDINSYRKLNSTMMPIYVEVIINWQGKARISRIFVNGIPYNK